MLGIFKKIFQFKFYLISALAPFAICTIVAVIIVITKGLDNFSWLELLRKVFHLNIGVIAHELVWFVGPLLIKWDMQPTIRGTWKFSVSGFALTYILVVIFVAPLDWEVFSLFKLFVEVAAVCIVVQVFLFQFGFYHYVYRLENENSTKETAPSALKNQAAPLLTLKSNDRIEKVNIHAVSHITVQDHYCTVFFQSDNEWEQRTVYERLRNYENRFQDYLVKVNRSTLVNPNMVRKIEKSNGKFVVLMKGEPELPISLSASQKHRLDNLIPIVS